MATINSNNTHLAIDGVDVSGYWTGSVEPEETMDTEDITSGAGVTHIQRAGKLKDNKIKFVVGYDDTDLGVYLSKMQVGTYTVLYGPEGNTTGKPKFECSMILKGVKGPAPGVDKVKVVFELEFEGAAAPTAELHTDTF